MDSKQIDGDDIRYMAGAVGKLWERFRRRRWPPGLKDSMASLLLAFRGELFQDSVNSSRTPSDVRGIAELFATLASREPSVVKNTFIDLQ